MNSPATLKADIATNLSLGHLSDDEKEKVTDELVTLVIERTQLEIWKRLTIEDRKAFANLREPEEITHFMTEKVPEIKSIIELCAQLTITQFNTALS